MVQCVCAAPVYTQLVDSVMHPFYDDRTGEALNAGANALWDVVRLPSKMVFSSRDREDSTGAPRYGSSKVPRLEAEEMIEHVEDFLDNGAAVADEMLRKATNFYRTESGAGGQDPQISGWQMPKVFTSGAAYGDVLLEMLRIPVRCVLHVDLLAEPFVVSNSPIPGILTTAGGDNRAAHLLLSPDLLRHKLTMFGDAFFEDVLGELSERTVVYGRALNALWRASMETSLWFYSVAVEFIVGPDDLYYAPLESSYISDHQPGRGACSDCLWEYTPAGSMSSFLNFLVRYESFAYV